MDPTRARSVQPAEPPSGATSRRRAHCGHRRVHGFRSRCLSDAANVVSLRALLALGDVVLDLLALGELAVAAARDGRVVHEDVSAAVVLLDEAEAFFGVEPLHGTA